LSSLGSAAGAGVALVGLGLERERDALFILVGGETLGEVDEGGCKKILPAGILIAYELRDFGILRCVPSELYVPRFINITIWR